MMNVFLSPHLDDAVLSCGQVIAGNAPSTVVTIMAGHPRSEAVLTPYDKSCGFANSVEAMRTRQNEDRMACAVLGAETIHCSGLDVQYRQEGRGSAWRDTLTQLEWLVMTGGAGPGFGKEDVWFIPMGLEHQDHGIVADVAMNFCKKNGFAAYVYEDLPYRVLLPEVAMKRFKDLWNRGVITEPLEDPARVTDRSQKREAILRYESQLVALDVDAACVPERYWRLVL
jgi:LmbE family N-acetylglucosaminyl deacetylase